jgi:hypothetical protein
MALVIPNVHVAGTPVVADDVNDNMDAIEAYVNGDLVLAADHATDITGRLASKLTDPVSLTSNSATFTTVADIAGFAITFTAIANRMYKLEVIAHASSSVAGDWIGLHLATNAGTTIQMAKHEIAVANEEQTFNIVAFVTPGAGSATYKVRGERLSGTGNGIVEAAATYPAVISVQDFGID